MPWVLRGLRDGIVTTRYPRRPDDYGPTFRAAVSLRPGSPAGLIDTEAGLCPTDAIRSGDETPGALRVDRARCIVCGRCVARRPDVFQWDPTVELAATSAGALVVPPDPDLSLDALRSEVGRRVGALRRSVHIRHVDAGSDGSEEAEIAALSGPIYDIERLGMFFTASPRHADLLLVTGVGTAGMVDELLRTYEAMPEPRVVVACGTDALSGGLVGPTYSAGDGVGRLVPLDVLVPGSPPSPFTILHGLLLALGRLPRRRGPR